MKNLFKATLLACASFFIASCTNDPSTEGVPQTPEKTVSLTIEAGTDDESRTTIVQGEDGKYQMLWNAAETEQNLAVVELLDGDTNPVLKGDNKVRKGTCKEVNEGSTKAVFDVPLLADDSFGHESYYYITCYPYEALEKFAPAEKKVYATLPATQSPKADDNNPALATVDPAATMLFSEYEAESEGQRPYWLSLSYKHMSAYVKMSFTGITLNVNEKIDHIIFTANDEDAHLTGAFSYDYENRTVAAESGADNSVTLNVSELNFKGDEETYVVPDFTVYFSTLPAKLSDFTVTVVANNNRRYTKHVTIPITDEKDYLTFETGKTRAVKINNSGFETEKQKIFKKVNTSNIESGKNYLIISQYTGSASTYDKTAYVLKNNGKQSEQLSGVSLEAAGFTATDDITLLNIDASDYTWTFNSTSNGVYTICSSTDSNIYLNASGDTDKSKLVLGTEAHTWLIEDYPYTNTEGYKRQIKNVSPYNKNYIGTDSQTVGGAWYTFTNNGWSTITMYEETDEEGDVNDKDKDEDKEYRYFTKVSSLSAGKEYIITVKHNGTVYTMNNYGGGFLVKTPDVFTLKQAGFESENETLIKCYDCSQYNFTLETSGSNYKIKSMSSESDREYLYYSSSFGLSTYYSSDFIISKTSNGFTAALSNNSNFYLQLYQPNINIGAVWTCGVMNASAGSYEIVFYEYTDDPNVGGEEPEEPEEPEEDAVEYSKITTNNLPVGTTATKDSTPVIITLTKGGSTYVLYNVPPEGDMDTLGTLAVTAKTLENAKFETTETGISGPISKYTWDATEYSKQVYKFNSTSRTGNYAMLVQSSKYLGYTNDQYGTNYALLKVDEEGNYRLKHNTSDYYMSVDESGNLVTANNENDAALVNLYGQPDAVAEQEETEANSTGPVFNAVSTVEAGKTYIVVGYVYGDYALGNDASFTKLEKDKALTAENYANFTFKVTAGYTGCIYLQSTATNQYLRVNNNVLAWNQYTTGSNWKYDNKKLVFASYGTSSSPYLCCSMIGGWKVTTNASDTGTQITFYEVVE